LHSQNKSETRNSEKARDESRIRKHNEKEKFNKLMTFINENNKMLQQINKEEYEN